MKAIVTGGAGFIGSHVVRELLRSGRETRVLHLQGENLTNLRGLDVELVPGDVTDRRSVEEAVKGCDEVYHLAAIYAVWLPRPQQMREVNVVGTRHVLRAAAEQGVGRVIHTSSIACFGGQGLDHDATEESPFSLATTGDPYCRSKHESHEEALAFAASGLDLTIVAPCGPLGPMDIGPTPTGKLLLSAVNLPITAVTRTMSNMVDVRAVARGYVLAAEKGRKGESYLLGGENLSLRRVVEIALEESGLRRRVLELPDPLLAGLAHAWSFHCEYVSRRPPLFTPAALAISRLGLRADCTKAFDELGLPRTDIRRAIRDALVWFARRGYVANPIARKNLTASSRKSDDWPHFAISDPVGDEPRCELCTKPLASSFRHTQGGLSRR